MYYYLDMKRPASGYEIWVISHSPVSSLINQKENVQFQSSI